MTKKEIKYLTEFEFKESNLYGLPKVHKSEEIKKKIKESPHEYVEVAQPKDLRMQPIVAGPSSVTSKLSNYLDVLLKPLLRNVKSYIRETVDVLNNLPEQLEDNVILATFDISSMYTNIDNDLGIEAIKYWLERDPEAIPNRIPKEFIIKGLKLVLQTNTFFFDGKHYLQIRGMAMGQKVAPTYVSLVMAYLELKLHQETEKEYGTENKNYILKNWKRFPDDCFIHWNLKIASLDHSHNLLNSLHPRIKFTKEWSEKEINFLDVTVIKNTNGKVTTDVFYKATDSFNYVNFKSGHPRHTKINIPFNLARRIRIIVNASDKEKTTKRMNHLNNILQSKEYPPDLITSAINKAKDIPQGELRKVKAKTQDKNTLAFVSTYNPHNPNIFPMIKNTLPILRQSNKLSKVVDNIKIINSKRQPPNLKKILTRARFHSDESTPTMMVTKCTDSRCK